MYAARFHENRGMIDEAIRAYIASAWVITLFGDSVGKRQAVRIEDVKAGIEALGNLERLSPKGNIEISPDLVKDLKHLLSNVTRTQLQAKGVHFGEYEMTAYGFVMTPVPFGGPIYSPSHIGVLPEKVLPDDYYSYWILPDTSPQIPKFYDRVGEGGQQPSQRHDAVSAKGNAEQGTTIDDGSPMIKSAMIFAGMEGEKGRDL